MEALETRIEQFNNWAAERVTVLETCYEGLKVPLNYRLNRKEPVHKEKAEYRRAIEELQEAIDKSVEDEAYVQESEKKVANTLKAWCGAHKIKDGMKDHFTGEKLQEQIHRMTTNALTSRLHPDDNELKEIIERQMKYYTVA